MELSGTAIVDKWKAAAAPLANRVVGSISGDIVRSVNRDGESSLGNVIADSQLEATAANGAQVALMNPGGVRADLTYAQSSGVPGANNGNWRGGKTFHKAGYVMRRPQPSGIRAVDAVAWALVILSRYGAEVSDSSKNAQGVV